MEQPRLQKPGPPKFLTQPKFLLLYRKKQQPPEYVLKNFFKKTNFCVSLNDWMR